MMYLEDEGRPKSVNLSAVAACSFASPSHATSVVSHDTTSSGREEPAQQVVVQDMEQSLVSKTSSRRRSLFTELLQVDEPIPSQQELEDAGVFDLEATSQRLAEWRREHGQSMAGARAHNSSSLSGRGAKASSPVHDTIDALEKSHTVSSSLSWELVDEPDQSICTSPSTSPRVSAFALVRKAIRPAKPIRTQSTPVLFDHTNLPLLSPPVFTTTPMNPWEQSLARHWPTSSRSNGTPCDERSNAFTSRLAVVADGPPKHNKLRKSMPVGLTIRTDCVRPNAPASSSAKPARSPNPSTSSTSPNSPVSIKRQWHRSLPFILTSPTRAHSDALDASGYKPGRSPLSSGPSSPAAAHPLSRRGSSRKKRGSTSSSDEGHLGDAEEVAAARIGRDGSRESALSSSSLWGLKLGRASGSSGHLRVPNGDRSRMPSERRIIGECGTGQDEWPPTKRSFEVLHRPTVGRSRSANAVLGERHDLSTRPKGIGLSEAASTSSPNLSKIEEEENGSLFSLTGSGSKRSPSLRLGRNRPNSDSSDDDSAECRSTRTRPSSAILRPTSRTHSPVPSSHLHHVLTRDPSVDSTEDDDPPHATFQTFRGPGKSPGHEQDDHMRVSSSFTSNRPQSSHQLSSGAELTSESDSSTFTSSSNWEHDHDDDDDTPASSVQLGESDLETDHDFEASIIHAKRLESIPIEGGEVIGWR
ncbi:BZ3500_MvSof-1268-A1-R1_Chr1-1g01053 [Microbotryum saponariae]|uniref:BZ3500_MvSof-1268-A1-R1_Chr1-1g01053 protein n=1 Tax=Microbotryum saponariae TaxID=289078 RepID=A0A2X0L148_9BASI|nr:BZ3500_MvSof-1268-A1-R1_Chr1-1g01053 [Microbotryum saponariae]SCZ93306.1 BZ3501_MvSof-1269-A2-R1_Chr1-1g00650 [Microbotryum saponariae]